MSIIKDEFLRPLLEQFLVSSLGVDAETGYRREGQFIAHEDEYCNQYCNPHRRDLSSTLSKRGEEKGKRREKKKEMFSRHNDYVLTGQSQYPLERDMAYNGRACSNDYLYQTPDTR